jgi:pimeloyl-ACP methyl ester carboxylesterase
VAALRDNAAAINDAPAATDRQESGAQPIFRARRPRGAARIGLMKPVVIVIHGINGSSEEMAPIAASLRPAYDVRAPDLLGHAGRVVPDGYTLEELAEDLVCWMDREKIARAYLLGYSLGGYLALYIARFYPERVRAVIGIIVKHVYDQASIDHIVYLANPARLSRPGNPRKGELERIHGVDKWEAVTNNTARLFQGFRKRLPLQIEYLKALRLPVLLLSGDQDPLVPVEQSKALARLLPNARLALFSGSAHPLRNVPLVPAMRAAKDFLAEVEHGTFKPGTPLEIASTLVSGGLKAADIALSIRPGRPKA